MREVVAVGALAPPAWHVDAVDSAALHVGLRLGRRFALGRSFSGFLLGLAHDMLHRLQDPEQLISVVRADRQAMLFAVAVEPAHVVGELRELVAPTR